VSCASFFKKSERLASPASTTLQVLEQLFRLGLMGEGNAGAEQGLEHHLSVGRSADALERHREVILNVWVARRRRIGGGEIGMARSASP